MVVCQVIFGGGRQAFFPADVPDIEHSDVNGTRTDGRNLIEVRQSANVNSYSILLCQSLSPDFNNNSYLYCLPSCICYYVLY